MVKIQTEAGYKNTTSFSLAAITDFAERALKVLDKKLDLSKVVEITFAQVSPTCRKRKELWIGLKVGEETDTLSVYPAVNWAGWLRMLTFHKYI